MGLETVESIQTKRFSPYTINFPWLNNTKFWFKFVVLNTTKDPIDLVYRINTVSFRDLSIYEKNQGSLVEIYKFQEKLNKNIEIPILLDIEMSKEYYFQVDFVKSIYFPFEIVSHRENSNRNSSRLLEYGLFYGFVLMVLLINLFFYINTKDKFFLCYCLLLLSIAFILVELDGLFYVFMGNSNLINHLDITFHLCLLISLILFTTKALRLGVYFPKLVYFGVCIIAINFIVFIIFVLTDNLLWYTLGEFVNVVGLIVYCIPGFLLLKKEVYAPYVVIGYSILFFLNVLYVLPTEFGLTDFGFTDRHFKIGSVFEMIIFLYAISYRHKNVEIEKRDLILNLDKKIQEDEFLNKSQVEILTFFIKKHKLTSRESEIVVFILKGATNKEIADKLSIQLTTVKYHVSIYM